MIFNEHSNLVGLHAFLGASQYHWLNYDLEKLEDVYKSAKAKERGTRLHEFASEAIKLGIRLKDTRQTINLFVNDAIRFIMESEQVLYYSNNCFGTADAISFRKNFLRIHDLKTGTSKASMNQLKIYAALFCLEYNYLPDKIKMELRIYQNDEVLICEPEAEEILRIMETIKIFDEKIEKLKREETGS